MTAGETWESCLDEIRALPSVQKYGDDVVVSMYNYDRPSYTGCKYEIECYFPTWAIPKDHKVTKALEDAYKNLYGETRLGNADFCMQSGFIIHNRRNAKSTPTYR